MARRIAPVRSAPHKASEVKTGHWAVKSTKSTKVKKGRILVHVSMPPEVFAQVRKGVPATIVVQTAKKLRLPKGTVFSALALAPSTMRRKVATNQKLSSQDSERVVGLRSLMEVVQRLVEESGNPEGFDAASWLGHWLEQPQPALGGEAPIEFLDTMAGQSLVRTLLERTQSGAYT
jgi:putative toxin-antitoxin system antitoxin component (TIGR02293 family)